MLDYFLILFDLLFDHLSLYEHILFSFFSVFSKDGSNRTFGRLKNIANEYRSTVEYNQDGIYLYRRLIYLSLYDQVVVTSAATSTTATATDTTTAMMSNTDEYLVKHQRSSEIFHINIDRCIARIDVKPMYDVQHRNSML